MSEYTKIYLISKFLEFIRIKKLKFESFSFFINYDDITDFELTINEDPFLKRLPFQEVDEALMNFCRFLKEDQKLNYKLPFFDETIDLLNNL